MADYTDLLSGDGYLDAMWRGTGFRGGAFDRAQDTVVAHKMVETFINAFARDGRYQVSFNESTTTAGTDMNARKVTITPAPIADPTLTPEQAGRILTGLAVHEISHPRYGKETAREVQRVFPYNPVADRISNLLDDVRIERAYGREYPGYANVFEPTLRYIGNANVERNGGKRIVPVMSDQANLAVAAVRYPFVADWNPTTAAEARWWIDWAERGAATGDVKAHVASVREALAHMVANSISTPPPSTPQASEEQDQDADSQDNKEGAGASGDEDPTDESDDAQEGSSDASEDASDDDGIGDGPMPATNPKAQAAADAMHDRELGAEAKGNNIAQVGQLPECAGSEAVEQAAENNGTSTVAIADLKNDADEVIESERHVEPDGHGLTVDVAKSFRGIVESPVASVPSDVAARYIRNAILRSRTGHTATDSFQRRGRLDQRGLDRLAHGDARIFERRSAPAPGRYDIWVMVDCSSSMDGGALRQAAQVAHAMATAAASVPTTRMTVWGWSYRFRPSSAQCGVVKAWETGQDPRNIFKMQGLNLGGTPDATILGWAGRAIRKDVRGEEKPVIIFISDGQGENVMNDRIAEARRTGVAVYGVSFGSSLDEAALTSRFGRGNYVAFDKDIITTAKGLAALFAKITSGRSTR